MSSALLTIKKIATLTKLKVRPSSNSLQNTYLFESSITTPTLIRQITTSTATDSDYEASLHSFDQSQFQSQSQLQQQQEQPQHHSFSYHQNQNPQFQTNQNHHFYTENLYPGEFQQYPNHQNSLNAQFSNPNNPNDLNGRYEGINQCPNGFQQTPSPIRVPHGVYYRECSVGFDGLIETSEDKSEFVLKQAIQLLGLLEIQGISLDLQRYFELMKLFGVPEFPQEAKAVHKHLVRSVNDVGLGAYNKILEMYCNCGSINDAYDMFENMPQRNLTSWDTMIMGLAKNGFGEEAIDLFTRFKEGGLKPDGQIFIGVFSVCSVLGDVDEGMLHFESMSKVYDISPTLEHYVSIVDMMGSVGYLDEALEFIEKMPFEPNVDVWEKMMNLSRVHGNKVLGDYCAEMVEHLDPSRLTEQSKAGLVPVKASDIAKEKNKKNVSGKSLLDVKSRVSEYRAGDKSHPDTDRIYALLRGLSATMKEAGYVPLVRCVLHDIDQEDKEDALLSHSERLALANGVMNTPARHPIRVIKNLRVCNDCHAALKIVSKLIGRSLIMRDAKRFHHFIDGVCSCKDYW